MLFIATNMDHKIRSLQKEWGDKIFVPTGILVLIADKGVLFEDPMHEI